jgi:hypothetical protein
LAAKKEVQSWKIVLLIGACIAALTVALVATIGNPFRAADVRIALPTIGQPAQATVNLTAGARLTFAVYAGEAHVRSQHDALMLHIELLKGGELAVETTCAGIDGGGDRASSLEGVTFGPAGCPMTVPDSGVDAIQAKAYWKSAGEGLTLTGVALKVFVDTE